MKTIKLTNAAISKTTTILSASGCPFCTGGLKRSSSKPLLTRKMTTVLAASTVVIFRVNKGLLEERFKPPVQKGQPLADKIVVVLLIAAFVSLIVFILLDVFRFHLMTKPGTLVSSL